MPVFLISTSFNAAARIMVMCGSMYVFERFFFSMKMNKSALRSLHEMLRLATVHDIKQICSCVYQTITSEHYI